MTDETHDNLEVDLDPATSELTSLQRVKAQQARTQNREVHDQRVESGAQVPGGSVPSDRRKHPQRQFYSRQSS